MSSDRAPFSRATHLSIVWGIALAFFTLIEWNGLDRDPMGQQIMLPYIKRDISVNVIALPAADGRAGVEDLELPPEDPDAGLQYEVDIRFDGPLFLACFFLPVGLFQLVGLLARRWGSRPG